MAKAETRAKAKDREGTFAEGMNSEPSANVRTPLERMADLTRRIIRVPKGELPLGKQKTKRPRR